MSFAPSKDWTIEQLWDAMFSVDTIGEVLAAIEALLALAIELGLKEEDATFYTQAVIAEGLNTMVGTDTARNTWDAALAVWRRRTDLA